MAKRTILFIAAILVLACGSAFASDGVKGPFAGTVHAVGSITYKDAAQKSWTWDRGKITALSSTSISLTRRDKQVVSFAITSSTLVRNDGASYTLADLKTGQAATVVSQAGAATIIRHIKGEGAPSGADQSAIDGPAKGSVTGSVAATFLDGSQQTFAYDRGRITAIGGGSLTIKRQDKQSVTFTYDATLLVREQGTVGGADDLKVGEGAMFFSQAGKLVLVRCLQQAKAAS
jgi:hypothetical protein